VCTCTCVLTRSLPDLHRLHLPNLISAETHISTRARVNTAVKARAAPGCHCVQHPKETSARDSRCVGRLPCNTGPLPYNAILRNDSARRCPTACAACMHVGAPSPERTRAAAAASQPRTHSVHSMHSMHSMHRTHSMHRWCQRAWRMQRGQVRPRQCPAAAQSDARTPQQQSLPPQQCLPAAATG
jgi:hypothetical protein